MIIVDKLRALLSIYVYITHTPQEKRIVKESRVVTFAPSPKDDPTPKKQGLPRR